MGIVVVLAIIASAVGGDDKASPPATTSASVATTSASAATTSASVSQDTVGTTAPTDPPIEAFSLGETAEMETLQITVNSAHWDKGSDFSKPDAGTRWLVFDCTLKNNGTESENISSLLMFKLTDQDSYTRDMQMFADTKGSLDGELAAGASMRGQIAFDVDEGQENWKFVFEPNVFGTGQLIFNISSSDVQ